MPVKKGSKFKDITGQKHGRLVAIECLGTKGNGYWWKCICECGTEKTTSAANLVSGNVSSCGCAQRECPKRLFTKHGRSTSKEYVSWDAMNRRCGDPRNPQFKNYGGRGIKVCDRWQTFENFLADMGPRPPGTSLDRYPDNDGNYDPKNCKWSSRQEQQRNKRNNRKITINSQTKSVSAWADIFKISNKTVFDRLKRGWTPERSLSEPVRVKYIKHIK